MVAIIILSELIDNDGTSIFSAIYEYKLQALQVTLQYKLPGILTQSDNVVTIIILSDKVKTRSQPLILPFYSSSEQ